ncbi:MAG: transglycosylase domain-containing protein [Paracoccaceae bacterium]|nr:transglycosylase domain-containing protein [Paracoccaceae bacterium]
MKKIIIYFLLSGLIAFLVVRSLVEFYSNQLPSIAEIIEYKPKTINKVLDRNEQILGFFYSEKREFIPIKKIPELVIHAFISAEDKNFYKHSGYDVISLLKAIIDFSKGAKLRGASTITQQVTKGLLLSGERSFERKIRELILAIQLEKILTKSEILEIYLNEVYLGEGAFGVSAAAKTYFAKSLENLLPREAAYLAALPKSPQAYNPLSNPENAIQRRNFVLDEMVENGYLSKGKLSSEKNSKLQTVLTGEIVGGEGLELFKGFLGEKIRAQVNTELGERYVNQGGLSIKTSIDSNLQQIARNALKFEIQDLNHAVTEYGLPVAHIEADHKNEKFKWFEALKNENLPKPHYGWNLAVVVDIQGENTLVVTDRSPEIQQLHFMAGVKSNLKIGSVVYVQDESDLKDRAPIWLYKQMSLFDGGVIISDLGTGDILALEGGYDHQLSSINKVTEVRRPRLEFLNSIILTVVSKRFFDWNDPNLNALASVVDIFAYSNREIQKDLLDDASIKILMNYGLIEEISESQKYFRVDSQTTIIDVISAYNMLVIGETEKKEHVLLEVSKGEQKVYPKKIGIQKCEQCQNDRKAVLHHITDEVGTQYFVRKAKENGFELFPLVHFDVIVGLDGNDEITLLGKHHTDGELNFDSVIGIISDKMFGCHIEAKKSNLQISPDTFSGSCLSLIQRIVVQDRHKSRFK